MKLGFIGMGSMGTAIALGLLKTGTICGSDLYFSTRTGANIKHIVATAGAQPLPNNQQVVKNSQILVLAVKPQQLPQVMNDIHNHLEKKTIIVSLLGGVQLKELESFAPYNPWVRVMPNVAAGLCLSATSMAVGSLTTPDQKEQVSKIFQSIGEVFELPEHLFNAFTPIAACAPAWTFQYAQALTQAALALGLPKTQGLQAVAQMLKGSAALLEQAIKDGKNTQDLINSVCSPAGSTIAGLLAGQDAGFSAATVRMVNAAAQKDAATTSTINQEENLTKPKNNDN